jgi:hypothetical protein
MVTGGGGMHQPRKQDAERGQALIEFALTVPIFLMLVFGIIDLARLVFAYTQVIDAARQGVRYGIVEGLEKGNYQYLDCNGIIGAAQDTPGLVPGSDLNVTVTYLNLQDNSVPIATCSSGGPGPSNSLLKDGAVLAVKVDGAITPITPILAMFDNSIGFDYTAKRAIAESAAFTDKWPSAPPVPKNFRSQQNCTDGRVYFFWDPLTIWPDEIQIKDSFTNATVQTIEWPETQYAYCKDNDPYEGRVCGADINPNNGYGMWYMVVIQDGLEGTSSLDATASCSGGGGGGGGGGGLVTISGMVYNDKNNKCKKVGNPDGLSGFTVKLYGAGADGAIDSPDDDLQQTITTNSTGYFSLVGTIPEGETYWHFSVQVSPPATYQMSCSKSAQTFKDMQAGDTGTVDFGAHH